MLGLPDGIRACLFDLDGVLTQTAEVHAAAWKQMFDALPARAAQRRARRRSTSCTTTTSTSTASRACDGVRDFLASRGIELPEGAPDDPPDAETVARPRQPQERARADAASASDGVEAYEGSVRYLRGRARRRACGARSSPRARNCRDVLVAAGHRRPVRGPRRRRRRRASGTCAASRRPTRSSRRRAPLGVAPAQAAVFEDALAGVAGRAAPAASATSSASTASASADALRAHGADVVVDDLAELLDA